MVASSNFIIITYQRWCNMKNIKEYKKYIIDTLTDDYNYFMHQENISSNGNIFAQNCMDEIKNIIVEIETARTYSEIENIIETNKLVV